jgi:hypothetical protein
MTKPQQQHLGRDGLPSQIEINATGPLLQITEKAKKEDAGFEMVGSLKATGPELPKAAGCIKRTREHEGDGSEEVTAVKKRDLL